MNAQMKLALQALAIARSTEADEAVLVVYLDALADMDGRMVARACQRLAKQPRLEYQAALPEVGLIRAEVATIAREDREAEHRRSLAAHSRREDDPTTWIFCRDCHDTSYRWYRCDGGTSERGLRDSELRLMPCARRAGHFAHTYAERCQCYNTNPEIQKAREQAHPQAAKGAA
jgi:hypothetical protein